MTRQCLLKINFERPKAVCESVLETELPDGIAIELWQAKSIIDLSLVHLTVNDFWYKSSVVKR